MQKEILPCKEYEGVGWTLGYLLECFIIVWAVLKCSDGISLPVADEDKPTL